MGNSILSKSEESGAADIEIANALCKSGNVEGISKWLQNKNNPNRHDNEGWTPLLWASARGRHEVVAILLENDAKVDLAHEKSKALPAHMAGHSGDTRTSEVLLGHKPEHLNAVWDLNGHTILLQAVFYGHLDLAEFLVKRGADTSITTARGLGPMDLARQFQNKKMMDLIRPYDSSQEAKATYYQSYLRRIAPDIPESQREQKELSDKLVQAIEIGIKNSVTDPEAADAALAAVRELIEVRKADVNGPGGPLQQPPLIVAVTGNNGLPPVPGVAHFRYEVATYLLENGADPSMHEEHPMGAQTIIRAAVFNHLDILKKCAEYMTPEKLANAINEIPVVNGLTALHDTVLRGTMAAPDHFEGYLEQTRWFIENGGRVDIEDFAGVTQRNIAERAKDENVRRRLLEVMDT